MGRNPKVLTSFLVNCPSPNKNLITVFVVPPEKFGAPLFFGHVCNLRRRQPARDDDREVRVHEKGILALDAMHEIHAHGQGGVRGHQTPAFLVHPMVASSG